MLTEVLNENEYFTHGPGSCFRTAAKMILHGDEAKFVALEIIKGLRNHIRKCGGPTGLASLSAEAGIIVDQDSLSFGTASFKDVQLRIDNHLRDARVKDRGPEAVYEARVVQRQWSRQQDSSRAQPSLPELTVDWCMEAVNSVLLDRIQPSLRQLSTSDRLARMEEIREEVRVLLEGHDADIAMDLADNQAVRIRVRRLRQTTEEMLHTSVFHVGEELR